MSLRCLVLSVSLVVASLLAALPAFSQSNIVVSLVPANLADSCLFPAPKEVVFRNPAGNIIKYPAEWTDVNIGGLLESKSASPIYLARFKNKSGEWNYAVDLDGSHNFSDKSVLKFSDSSERMVADADLSVPYLSGKARTNRPLRVQVIRDSGRVWVRVGECREGKLNLDNKEFPVRLVLTSTGNLDYSLTGGTACLIDPTGGNDFSPIWRLAENGDVIPTKRVPLGFPFVIDNRKLKVLSLDSAGTKLVIGDYDRDTVIALGFYAPSWHSTDLSGKECSARTVAGKVTLLMFWSTTCPFCEKVRPALNGMMADDSGSALALVACCLESDTSQIRSFLKDQPYDGTIVPYDSVLWQQFNHRLSTPAFCLLDQKGIIRFAGSGASMFPIAQKVAEGLLEIR